jgi:preprotein translocase subunit YajC
MAKKLQITKDAMDKLHKGEEVSIDGVTLTFSVNEEKIEIDDKTKFVIDLKHLLDKHVMKEGSCGYNENVKTGKKLTTPGGLKETIQFVSENNPGITKEELVKEVQEIKRLGKTLTEELCARGKNYIAARKRAGEKSSAYLSGRGVKVCKGQIKGSDGKRKKG